MSRRTSGKWFSSVQREEASALRAISPAAVVACCSTVYINVDEVALRGGDRVVVAEQADLVANARVADVGDAQAGVDLGGKRDRREVAALRFDDEADDSRSSRCPVRPARSGTGSRRCRSTNSTLRC